ncbi:MAG: hypothetical protein EAX96_13385 [Candidatus Lokiarchaeota archaeon]|nr:hypothetical protein [Candidatus Lokiarchaeota archaeon]
MKFWVYKKKHVFLSLYEDLNEVDLLEQKIKEYDKGRVKRLVDDIKLGRNGKTFTYGEITDDLVTKRFFPLSRHLWRVYKEIGYTFIDDFLPDLSDALIYDVAKLRLDDAIQSAKNIVDGNNKYPEKTLTWSVIPPVLALRGDLAQGTMKLIYGDSCDVSFIGIFDTQNEILGIFNGHVEDGVPVDWWVVGPDDGLLDRRHRKLGIKLKDLPKKSKNIQEMGLRLIETLKDVRNERTPEWATSKYVVGMLYASGVVSCLFEPSTWEVFGQLWNGINAKRIFGMNDSWFAFTPMPQLLNMFTLLDRPEFVSKMSGLSIDHKMAIQLFEEQAQNYAMELEPEIYFEYFESYINEGAFWPKQTLGYTAPDFKNKKTYKSEEALCDWKYPKGERITPESLGMTIQEFTKGIYFDISHETEPGSVDPTEKIISKGWGMDTTIV